MRFPFFITFFVLYTGVLEKAQNYITAKINTILKVQNEIAIDDALSREGLSWRHTEKKIFDFVKKVA